MQLIPRSILNREGTLGRIDLALRTDGETEEDRVMYQVAIIDGIAYVFTNNRYDRQFVDEYWTLVETIGPAEDVAIEFDGYWDRNVIAGHLRYRFKSVGEPFIFYVREGTLYVKQGESTTSLATGVTKVSTVRGWKNVETPTIDQGLICAYLKGGYIYYRNRCEQEDGSVIWESEKQVLSGENPIAAVNLFAFHTMDYRSGIMYETSTGEIRWILTKRDWARMGTPPEFIKASIQNLDIDLQGIYYIVVGDGPYPNESVPPTSYKQHQKEGGELSSELITAQINCELMFLWAMDTQPVAIENLPMTDTVTGEEVGTGNGIETTFYLLHTPDDGTLTIYLNGVEEMGFTRTGKEIVFNSPPGIAVAITADYQWVNWGKKIKITYDHGISDVAEAYLSFKAIDAFLNEYAATAIELGDPWADPIPLAHFDGSREVILTLNDFNSAAIYPDTTTFLKVVYTPIGIKGEAGQDLEVGWDFTFTAINLDPLNIEPPAPEAIWNE